MQIDTVSYTTKNYNGRPVGKAIDSIVVHTAEGNKTSDLRELTTAGTQKSAHFYIDRAGNVYQLVDPKYRAWHAGISSYLGRTDFNNFSIGIETEHRAGQDWPAIQRQALTDLCGYLLDRHPIQPQLIVAHRWIATPVGRKSDPTDWPDPELKSWIASLFVDPWARRWGDVARPTGDQWNWASVVAWKQNWQRLGKCRSHLLYDNDHNAAVQLFDGGDVRLFNNVAEIALK